MTAGNDALTGAAGNDVFFFFTTALNASTNVGAAATTAAQHILYNATTGWLSYDADGNGAAAAIHFATLTTHPAITNADFVVV